MTDRADVRIAPEVWVIKYDDAEVEDEVFIGEGAEIAARLTYEKRLAGWNCHLLVSVERLSLAEQRVGIALEALEAISQWKMPNNVWIDGVEMSWGVAYGSNGEREVILKLARAAIERLRGK